MNGLIPPSNIRRKKLFFWKYKSQDSNHSAQLLFPLLTENYFFSTIMKAAADCQELLLCLCLSPRKLSFCDYQGSISATWGVGGMLPHLRSSSWIPVSSSLSEWKQALFCKTWGPSSHPDILVPQLWTGSEPALSPPSFSLTLDNSVLSVLLRSLSQALFYAIRNPRTFFHGNHKLKWCLVQPEYFRFWKYFLLDCPWYEIAECFLSQFHLIEVLHNAVTKPSCAFQLIIQKKKPKPTIRSKTGKQSVLYLHQL